MQARGHQSLLHLKGQHPAYHVGKAVPWLCSSPAHCWEGGPQVRMDVFYRVEQREAFRESDGFQEMLDRNHRRRREDGGWQDIPMARNSRSIRYKIVANCYP